MDVWYSDSFEPAIAVVVPLSMKVVRRSGRL